MQYSMFIVFALFSLQVPSWGMSGQRQISAQTPLSETFEYKSLESTYLVNQKNDPLVLFLALCQATTDCGIDKPTCGVWLLQYHTVKNMSDDNGFGLLHYAIVGGADNLAMALVPMPSPKHDQTAINLAYTCGCSGMVNDLLRHNRQLNRPIETNTMQAVVDRLILRAKASSKRSTASPGNSKLHNAVMEGNFFWVSWLLRNKFFQLDPNRPNRLLQTPLHLAAQCGNLEMVKLVFDIRSLNVPDCCGHTALDYARQGKNEVLIEVFEKNKAFSGGQVLHTSADQGDLRILQAQQWFIEQLCKLQKTPQPSGGSLNHAYKLAVKYGCVLYLAHQGYSWLVDDLRWLDASGKGLLHHAVKALCNRRNVIDSLLSVVVALPIRDGLMILGLRDTDGKIALDLATDESSKELLIKATLQLQRASVQAFCDYYNVKSHEHGDIIRYLAGQGFVSYFKAYYKQDSAFSREKLFALLNAPDQRGKSPLDDAKENGHQHFVDYAHELSLTLDQKRSSEEGRQ